MELDDEKHEAVAHRIGIRSHLRRSYRLRKPLETSLRTREDEVTPPAPGTENIVYPHETKVRIYGQAQPDK